jgi:hypothetical protein
MKQSGTHFYARGAVGRIYLGIGEFLRDKRASLRIKVEGIRDIRYPRSEARAHEWNPRNPEKQDDTS